MINLETFRILCFIWIGIALLLFPVLLKITQPYGRHSKSNWGPSINNRAGWIIMEAPALLVFAYFIFARINSVNLIIMAAAITWIVHYFHRVAIYPFRIKTQGKKMPVLIAVFGVFFNLVNGLLNGYWLAEFIPNQELTTPTIIRVTVGSLIFMVGFVSNKYHDKILIGLRNKAGNGYKIPFGGWFKYISCPNFLGEIITWAGFFVISFSLPAFSFFIWSIVNLLPRALDHHRWYKKEFENYPANRKALIPHVL